MKAAKHSILVVNFAVNHRNGYGLLLYYRLDRLLLVSLEGPIPNYITFKESRAVNDFTETYFWLILAEMKFA